MVDVQDILNESNSITLKIEYVKTVTAHTAATAVLGDILGKNLNTYTAEERTELLTKWLRSSKGKLPNNRLRPDVTTDNTALSDIFYNALHIMLVHDPCKYNQDVGAFDREFKILIRYYDPKNNELDLLIGVATAFGLYGALTYTNFNNKENWELVSKYLKKSLNINKKDIEAFDFYTYLIFGLTRHGYFSIPMLNEATSYTSTRFQEVAALFTPKQTHEEIVDIINRQALTHLEYMLFFCCAYLIKLSDYNSTELKSKEYIGEIVKLDSVGQQYLLFMFGALFVSSEHMYALYIKTLLEKSLYFDHINTLISNYASAN